MKVRDKTIGESVDVYDRQLRQKANEGETLAIGLVLLIETLRGATSA